ncbi:MAG: hypothetical protein JSV64_03755 [Candidatus Bathyarchaeota archaeon]|nr:MAG: hypothetical protein JSV64_03755 [Candidatus Bathyarchaeota archaeon]
MKIKGVAALTLLVIVMAGASFYTMNRSAIAAAEANPEEPKCTVYFDPDFSTRAVGEAFKVLVAVDDVENLWGFELGLAFDPDVIQYVGAKEPAWRFISGIHPRMEYLFWVAGIYPQNGAVELMEFNFEAVGEGTSSLSLYMSTLATLKYLDGAKDEVGWPIPHKVSEGLVTVW